MWFVASICIVCNLCFMLFFFLSLHYQTTRKMVKRRTVGLSHFLGCAEGPSCETEGIPGKDFGYVNNNNHFNPSNGK